jgi:hypothetical protein
VEPTTWNAGGGTVLGINAPSGFNGNFLDFHLNGAASVFSVNSGGQVNIGAIGFANFSNQFNFTIGATNVYNIAGTLIRLNSQVILGWTASATGYAATDIGFSRASAGTLQLGLGQTANNNGTLNLATVNIIGDTVATASSPQLLVTTPPYTAGTGSTNQPVAYFDSGTLEPTTWNTNGTVLGINAPASYGGNFLDCRSNGGSSLFAVNSNGAVAMGALSIQPVSNAYFEFLVSGTVSHFFGLGYTRIGSTNLLGWASGNALTAIDCCFNRLSAGILQLHNAQAAGSAGSLKLAHVLGGSTTPTSVAGTGAGTAPTIAIGGSDSSGSISVTTGAAPAASSGIVTLTFSAAYPAAPFLSLTPTNAAAAMLTGAGAVYITKTAGGFTLNAGATALAASTAYTWDFLAIG